MKLRHFAVFGGIFTVIISLLLFLFLSLIPIFCEENIFGEIPHELQKHIDYHSYGNELEMDDRYRFTTSGVFRYQ